MGINLLVEDYKTIELNEHEMEHIIAALDSYIYGIDAGFNRMLGINVEPSDEMISELKLVRELLGKLK